MRAKALRDEASALGTAEEKCIEQGREQAKLEIAKNLLDIIEDDEIIAQKIDLSVEEVKKLREG